MPQLQGEKLEAEIVSFTMTLHRAYHDPKAGPYLSVHRDVVQGLINQNTDLKGTNMALEERISDLELELTTVNTDR